MFKRINCLIICLFILLSLTACTKGGKSISSHYDKISECVEPDNNMCLENSFCRLELDKTTMGVILTDKESGEKWYSTPSKENEEFDELGMPIKKHPLLNSVLVIKYLDSATNTEIDAISYTESVKKKQYRCFKKENSILVEFYFDSAEIMVPVEYCLVDGHIKVKVDTESITENNNRILKLSLMPFMCSAENDSENSYLFVPSGSGTIIEPRTYSKTGVGYSSQVYGMDCSIEKKVEKTKTESIHLPTFGAKSSSDKGMCAIIESGADSSWIDVNVGSSAYKYSTVYASLQLRGYTNHTAKIFSKTVENYSYSRNKIKETFSVDFYPLKNEDANYVGMADVYRDYLQKTAKLENKQFKGTCCVTLLGGGMTTESFLGIPYKTLCETTTLEQAEKIIQEISDVYDNPVSVILKGFGESGVDIGSIAGGYSINSKLGNVEKLKKLIKKCKNNDIDVYMDFDMICFNESSDGFSTFSDVSYAASQKKATQYLYNAAVKDQEKSTYYYLLTPLRITDAFDKLIKKTENWGLEGYSFEKIPSVTYSDYKDKSDSAFYAKNGISNIVVKSLEKVSHAKKNIAVNNANDYAAVLSNLIVNVPSLSDGQYIFSEDIPFYQIVFKGYVPLYSESLNLSADLEASLLRAVECGTGLNYTLISQWNNKLINSDYPIFYNSVYSDVKGRIKSCHEKTSKYFKIIEDSKIANHEILESGVHKTSFENGAVVYVNYNRNVVLTEAGSIQPNDFIVLEGNV